MKKVGIENDPMAYVRATIFDYDYENLEVSWDVIKQQFRDMFVRLSNEPECTDSMKKNYTNCINSIDGVIS